ELQPKLDAVAPAREAAMTAEAARIAAEAAAREAARELEPVSVFISRKTQHLYVRRGFQPILEGPVTIQDPRRPIGTHVFTAMERSNATDMRWTVVSLDGGRPSDVVELPGRTRSKHGRDMEAFADAGGPRDAMSALDRIVIPPEALERIAGMA